MQSNTITLAVDVDNDGGTTPAVDLILSRFEDFQNRSEYISPLHSLTMKEKLGLYRTFPKANGTFRGTAKCAVKFTKDFVVAGVDSSVSLTVPSIAEASFSLPVGLTVAQTLEIRMRLVALLLNDGVMAPLMNQLMV